MARLERAEAEAQLAALKAQVDPHFLFNSLNTLGHLITREPARAREFCDTLAEVYRYVLASRERDTVPLAEELAFVQRYQRLLALRFGFDLLKRLTLLFKRGALLFDTSKQVAGAVMTATLAGANPLAKLQSLEAIFEAQGDISAARKRAFSWS